MAAGVSEINMKATRRHEWMFLLLGVAYQIMNNFLLSTSRSVDTHIFPKDKGFAWSFAFYRFTSAGFVLGFAGSSLLKMNQRISTKIVILCGYILCSVLTALFVIFLILFPETKFGYYGALLVSAFVSLFCAFGRAKSVGVALAQSRNCCLMETQGSSFGGLLAAVWTICLQNVLPKTYLGTQWKICLCFAVPVVWFAMCACFYKWLDDLSPKVRQMDHEEALLAQSLTRSSYSSDVLMDSKPRSDFDLLWTAKFDVLNVLFVTAVTFTLFPGVINQWKPPSFLDAAAYGTYSFFVFRIADNLGRFLPRYVSLSRWSLLLFNIARMGFIFTFCASERLPTSIIFGNFIFQLVDTFLLGSSHGYGLALGNVYSSYTTRDSSEKERLGPYVGFFNLLGIQIGSQCARLTRPSFLF